MGKISFHKVTAQPVAPYAADALYFYKTGTGFRLLVTDSAGGAIYGLETPTSTTASLESADLKAIAALTDTTGLLKKTAAGAWALDTSAYLTGINSSMVTTALGYTPVNPNTRGAANGIATLGADGKVPSAQLPSFVDDVVDVATFAALPPTGEASKIYLLGTPHTLNGVTSSQFRWSGTAYAPIVSSPGSTDAVPEGATNLYFTPARAQAAVTSVTGNAGTATKLATARTISITGAINYTVTFDGSGNATAVATLGSADLASIAGLAGAAGLLRKTAAGTYSLDTSAYLTTITSAQVISALGFTPYNATNPSGFITSSGSITGNAGTVGGLAVHAARNNEANKVVRTDAQGYTNLGWINTPSGDNGLSGLGRIYASGDDFIRYYQPVNFSTAMNRALYARETNNGTLVPGTRYSIWTGGGAISMAMPTYANASQGDEIEIVNLHQTWETNAFTITCPASVKINMLTESLVCDYNVGGFTMVCVSKDATAAYWTVRA